jgi:ATP-dependent DNA helicase PIF1
MISKDLIETVDRSFHNIMKIDAPFSGCLMVFGGDFRQVLLIIPKASRSIIVRQCLNKANF